MGEGFASAVEGNLGSVEGNLGSVEGNGRVVALNGEAVAVRNLVRFVAVLLAVGLLKSWDECTEWRKTEAKPKDIGRSHRESDWRNPMPGNDYIPREDAHLVGWYKNFVQQCTEKAQLLGLDEADLEAIQQARQQFEGDWLSLQESHAAYRQAVGQKDGSRAAAVELARQFARQFKANRSVSSAVQAGLGIVSETRSGPVVPVNELVAAGDGNGVISLRWSRNGNSRGTSFLVEYRAYTEGEWRTAGVTTKTRFRHSGQIVGQPLQYRVTSIRSDEVSVPCPSAGVYLPNRSEDRSIAA